MTQPTTQSERALVIVPTYNERESIPEVVRRLFDAAPEGVDLLVVDDGSPDGTAEIVKQLPTVRHVVVVPYIGAQAIDVVVQVVVDTERAVPQHRGPRQELRDDYDTPSSPPRPRAQLARGLWDFTTFVGNDRWVRSINSLNAQL